MRTAAVDTASTEAASFTETATQITVKAGEVKFIIEKSNAQLAGITRKGHAVSLSNGPALASGTAALTSIAAVQLGRTVSINAAFSGNFKYVRWTIYGNGLCKLAYSYNLNGSYEYYGVNFNYPEAQVKGLRWLGKGPYRVWKNRLKGGTFDVWTAYNDPIPGQSWIYPEFKGYFANTQWAALETKEETLQFLFEDENVFFRNFTPQNGVSPLAASMAFPAGNISFLQAIPAMGDKFAVANGKGPQGALSTLNGDIAATVYLHFGPVESPTGLAPVNRSGPYVLETRQRRGPSALEFFAPVDGNIRLTLHDIRGVSHLLFAGRAERGWHSSSNGIRLTSGVYLARLSIDGKAIAVKTLTIQE